MNGRRDLISLLQRHDFFYQVQILYPELNILLLKGNILSLKIYFLFFETFHLIASIFMIYLEVLQLLPGCLHIFVNDFTEFHFPFRYPFLPAFYFGN